MKTLNLKTEDLANLLQDMIDKNLAYADSTDDQGEKKAYQRIADQIDSTLGFYEDNAADAEGDKEMSVETFMQSFLELMDQGQNPKDWGME